MHIVNCLCVYIEKKVTRNLERSVGDETVRCVRQVRDGCEDSKGATRFFRFR